jgi:hypothetical protein
MVDSRRFHTYASRAWLKWVVCILVGAAVRVVPTAAAGDLPPLAPGAHARHRAGTGPCAGWRGAGRGASVLISAAPTPGPWQPPRAIALSRLELDTCGRYFCYDAA